MQLLSIKHEGSPSIFVNDLNGSQLAPHCSKNRTVIAKTLTFSLLMLVSIASCRNDSKDIAHLQFLWHGLASHFLPVWLKVWMWIVRASKLHRQMWLFWWLYCPWNIPSDTELSSNNWHTIFGFKPVSKFTIAHHALSNSPEDLPEDYIDERSRHVKTILHSTHPGYRATGDPRQQKARPLGFTPWVPWKKSQIPIHRRKINLLVFEII